MPSQSPNAWFARFLSTANGNSDSGRMAFAFSACSSTFDEPQKVHLVAVTPSAKTTLAPHSWHFDARVAAAGAEALGRLRQALEEIVLDDRSSTGGNFARGAAMIALELAARGVELHLGRAFAAGETLRLYCFFRVDGGHGLALGPVVSCQAYPQRKHGTGGILWVCSIS